MNSAIILAIIAHIFWASGNLANVKLSRTITPLQTITWQTILLIPLLLLFIISEPLAVDVWVIAYTALLSTTLYAGSLMFYTALKKGSAQISGAIIATVPAFVTLLSIIFLGASLSIFGILLITIITIGLVITSLPNKNNKIDNGIIYAFAAVVLWAVYFTFISKSVEVLGPYWSSYIAILAGSVMLVVYSIIKREHKIKKVSCGLTALLALSALFVGGAPLAYNIALEQSNPAIIAPIAGSYAPLFIITSSIIYKDKVTKKQWLGIAITITAVIVFSVIVN
ncbi:MAG: DMT family transporter [Candidatus Saccharibacteria bacterium]|nr:DMT family transporter [Candidatus Saccharibacteria bacterium]